MNPPCVTPWSATAGQLSVQRLTTLPSVSTVVPLLAVTVPTVGTVHGAGSRVLGSGSSAAKLLPKAKTLEPVSLSVSAMPPPCV